VDQILSVCTGIGGLDLGLHAGLRNVGREPRTVCMVEREAFAVAVLGKAIAEERLDDVPIWFGDLRDLPSHEIPRVDWITGGYPCQPFSQAGKRLGEDDHRHLWPVILDLIRTLRPCGVFFENVSGHMSLGLDRVLQDLAGCGFRSAFGLFTAEEVGAPHRRERVFILGLADANRERGPCRTTRREDAEDARQPSGDQSMADASSERSSGRRCNGERPHQWPSRPGSPQRSNEPSRTTQSGLGRNADGVSDRVDRLRALGNAVVPQQAELAFIRLWNLLQETA
jgi:DNA (cytosine-5)-methyltransferase 1